MSKETSFEEITFEIQLIQVLPTGPEKTFEHCPDPESPSEDEVIVNIAPHRICHWSVKAERTENVEKKVSFHLPLFLGCGCYLLEAKQVKSRFLISIFLCYE